MRIIIYNILLNEDAQYDKNIRVITRKALESIRNFLLRHMSNEEIAQLLSSIGSGNPLATNTKTPVLQQNFITNGDNINFIKIPTDVGDLIFGIDLGNFIKDIFENRAKSNRKLQEYKTFIDSLTTKNRNRFYNRLYNNSVEIWKPNEVE